MRDEPLMIPDLPTLARARDFPPGHPARNVMNHDKLLRYIKQRLESAKPDRDARIGRIAKIDRNIAGWILENEEERKAERKRNRTGKPIAQDSNLPLTLLTLDDAVTFFLQVFAPQSGFFHGIGRQRQKEALVTGFTEVMNRSAGVFGYYEETHKHLMDSLKYNMAAFTTRWKEMTQNTITQAANGKAEIGTEVVWAGNEMQSLDMYNLFLDPSVPGTKCYSNGEFFAFAELKNLFTSQRLHQQGIIYNMDAALKEASHANTQCVWYRDPISEIGISINDIAGNALPGGQNYWRNYLGASGAPAETQRQLEFVTMYIHITPKMFGLAPQNDKTRDGLEVWRIVICNDKYIVAAARQVNLHQELPVYVANPYPDSAGILKSMGELMDPFQVFASFLMNTHKKAVRKNLWGITYYNKSKVDLESIPDGEVVARIPVNMLGMDDDIRKHVYHDNNYLDTKQNIQDIATVLEVQEKFFPVQGNPAQIASIDRAVTDQVQAVLQGANGRKQKLARLIDEQAYKPARRHMVQNIQQFMPSVEFTDNDTGQQVEFDPKSLNSVDLSYMIGQGLKTLDRQQAATFMMNILDRVIQSREALGEIDVLGMLDSIGEHLDIDVDLSQFRRTPEQQQQLAEGAAAAQGQGGEAPPAGA